MRSPFSFCLGRTIKRVGVAIEKLMKKKLLIQEYNRKQGGARHSGCLP